MKYKLIDVFDYALAGVVLFGMIKFAGDFLMVCPIQWPGHP